MDEPESDGSLDTAVLTRAVAPAETNSGVVVRAVAAASDTPPSDLPPLHGAIDPDALNALFVSDDGRGQVSFRYQQYTVEVRADGTVTLYEALDER